MKIGQYEVMTVGRLKKLLAKMPDSLKIVSSSDDEGNSHSWVLFEPTVGEMAEYEFIDSHTIAECKAKFLAEDFTDDIDKKVTTQLAKFKGEPALCIN